MIIETAHVKNYRCILDESLNCDNLTALVGPNGCGKSTFLRALDLFYNKTPKVDVGDYYNEDTSKDISISITFKDLSPRAKELFGIYIQNDKLIVERIFQYNNGKPISTYHGSSRQNPEFDSIRNAVNANDAKNN
ncbi:MAG: AAA family ATPase [Elusimicrobiota bacterium]